MLFSSSKWLGRVINDARSSLEFLGRSGGSHAQTTSNPTAGQRNKDTESWIQELAPTLDFMMRQAGYSDEARCTHVHLFNRLTCQSLGHYPQGSAMPYWKSYMNDDHTPIEFSWSWTGPYVSPKVRYAVEPIAKLAGTASDPYNTTAPGQFIEQLRTEIPTLDLSWYNHFNDFFAPKAWDDDVPKKDNVASSKFIALEPDNGGGQSVKAYFIPKGEGTSRFSALANAIRLIPGADVHLLNCVDDLARFLLGFETSRRPQAEILGIDCVVPSQARLKIYLRTRDTSFDSMVNMMTLSKGQLPPEKTAKLRDFWRSILDLDDSVKDSDSLPTKTHSTAGIIYHFDLRLTSSVPKVKVYIPVKHYGGNDLRVAERFSTWLQDHGRGLQGMSYLDAVRTLCKHRALDEGLGFQTYFSATFNGEELAVTSYFQPEMYHCRRREGA